MLIQNQTLNKTKTMKSLTLKQYVEVVQFVQKYHKFALWQEDEEIKEKQKLYPNIAEYGMNIKYIDNIYDSRGKDIWSIGFRGMGSHVKFTSNTTLTLTYDNMFDWIMDYLTGDWKPNTEEDKSIRIIN